MIYRLLRSLFSAALGVFYRWTQVTGEIPSSGPVIIAGNHQNGLIDPVAVMRLTHRPVRFMAKAPLFRIPVLGGLVRSLGCLAVYRKQDDPTQMSRNDETFAAAHQALSEGGAICIFPEGKSHSLPALEPLKTGAARIALAAEEKAGFKLGVRLVPVGFVYRNKARFRGQVAVEVGKPILAASLAEAYRADPVEASHRLTQWLDAGLHQVTLNLESWEDLPLLEAARAIYLAERGGDALLRPFADGLSRLRDTHPDHLDAVRRRVLAFTAQLQALGLKPESLDRVPLGTAARFALRQLLLLGLGFPLAVAGGLAYAVPHRVARLVATLTRPQDDIAATVKLGTSILLFPAWALGSTLVGGRLWGAVGALLCGPGLAAAAFWALWMLERERSALEDTRAFLSLWGHQGLRRRLLHRRSEISKEIESLGREAGLLP